MTAAVGRLRAIIADVRDPNTPTLGNALRDMAAARLAPWREPCLVERQHVCPACGATTRCGPGPEHVMVRRGLGT